MSALHPDSERRARLSLVQQSFDDRGINLNIQSPAPGELAVAVFGFTPQPLFLGMNAAWPCLLLPSPDVVVLPTNFIYHLPLPANLRPVSFYVQGVTLTAQGLLATDGYLVAAH